MKSIKISILTLSFIQTLSMAGGHIVPEPEFQNEDIKASEQIQVIKDPIILPKVIQSSNVYSNGFYVGLGISTARYKTECNCPDAPSPDKTAGVVGRIGYDFNQYIGLEARGIKTNWKSNGHAVEHYGLFAKPMIPIADSANLYALLGAGKTTTSSATPLVNAKSFAWGFGAEVDLTSDEPKEGRYNREFDGQGDQESGLGLFIDYERLVAKSNAPDLDTINTGISYDF